MNTNLKKVLLALASFAIIAGAPACKKKDRTVTSSERTVTRDDRGGYRHHRDEDRREGKEEKKKMHKKTKKTRTVKETDME